MPIYVFYETLTKMIYPIFTEFYFTFIGISLLDYLLALNFVFFELGKSVKMADFGISRIRTLIKVRYFLNRSHTYARYSLNNEK